MRLAVAAATIGLSAHAAEPSFDCTAPASSAEEAVCGSEELAALDVELDRLYRADADAPRLGGTPCEAMSDAVTSAHGIAVVGINRVAIALGSS